MRSDARVFLAWGRRLYRLALRAMPPAVRDRYGEEMVAAFRDGLEERVHRSRGAAVGFLIRCLADAIRVGIRERVGGGSGRRSEADGNARAAGADGTKRRKGTRMAGTGGTTTRPARAGRATRRARGDTWRDLGADLRFAARSLRRSPGFSVAAVTLLALGIGANSAVFGALRTVLLRPPPFSEPERLVLVDLLAPAPDGDAPRPMGWSYPKYRMMTDAGELPFSSMGGYGPRTITLTGAGDPVRLDVEVVTHGYFETLGLVPAAGRFLDAATAEAEGAEPATVLSWSLWRSRFGGDPGAVGRTVHYNGRPVRVVGVGPRGFGGLTGTAQAWIPVETGAALVSPVLMEAPRAHWFRVVARLSPGAGLADAEGAVARVGRAIDEAWPDEGASRPAGAGLRRFEEVRTNPAARTALLVLSAAAAILLLVACANLAGLLMTRHRERSRETAVRLALGAGRWRVMRGHLAESLLLAGAGGAIGLAVAEVGVRLLAAAWPETFLRSAGGELRIVDPASMGVDSPVVVFAVAVSLVAGLLAGVAPALRWRGPADPGEALKEGTTSTRRSGRSGRWGGRQLLVGAEVGLALVLVVGSGLMLSSLVRIVAVERGFRAEGLLSFAYSLPRDADVADPGAFHDRFLESIEGLPGVEGATVGCVPLRGRCWVAGVRSLDGVPVDDGGLPGVGIDAVDEDHFEVLGTPLVRGRAFTPADGAGAPPVMILNETAARRLFPGQDPLGRRVGLTIELTPEGGGGAEVVGVVGDVLYGSPTEGATAEAYVPYPQMPGSTVDVLVRATGEPLELLPAVRERLAALDPDLPLFRVSTVDHAAREVTADTRTVLRLLLVFAGLAVLLAATGVWSVVAYTVSRRTRELGLRVALGADRRGVVRLVLKSTLLTTGVGLVAGLGAAWAGSRLLSSLLYGVSPSDPVTYGAATLLLLAVVLLAGWIPARRATRLAPMEVLRTE